MSEHEAQHGVAAVETDCFVAEQDSAAVEQHDEARDLTAEEVRTARESLAGAEASARQLEVRTMPRPKELDPRQSFEWTPRITQI